MKIAAIVPYNVYPAKMGGQKGIAIFYDHLSRLQPLSWLTVSSNQAQPNSNIIVRPVLSSGKSRYLSFTALIRLIRTLKSSGTSHLILEHPYLGWMGLAAKTFLGIRLISHSHNIEALRFRSTGKWWWKVLWQYEKMTHRISDLNFFISDEDRDYAVSRFGLRPSRCVTIPYGIDNAGIPSDESRKKAKEKILTEMGLEHGTKLFFFNGTLDYPPNKEALELILKEINPRLIQSFKANYRIIICGKSLPAEFDNLNAYRQSNVIYAGFVDNIESYFLGTDVFINPVVSGGGIKTKLVEALGSNLSAVSTRSGAAGISTEITGEKLAISEDTGWDDFVSKLIVMAEKENLNTPVSFFNNFYWGNIAVKAFKNLENIS